MSRAWQQPWPHVWMNEQGWIPGREAPPAFPHPLYSWFSELPTHTGDFVTFIGDTSFSGRKLMTLTYLGDRKVGSRTCAVVRFQRPRDSESEETTRQEFLIDRQAFEAGHTPAKCLVWDDPVVTPAQQQDDLGWFRGLPLLKAYNPGYERYLHLPLRKDAFLCQRAAVQFDVSEGSVGKEKLARRYRCDTWLSPEIPFGTARVEWTITSLQGGEQLQKETWTVFDCSPKVAASTPVTVEMFEEQESVLSQVRRKLNSR